METDIRDRRIPSFTTLLLRLYPFAFLSPLLCVLLLIAIGWNDVFFDLFGREVSHRTRAGAFSLRARTDVFSVPLLSSLVSQCAAFYGQRMKLVAR
jgi:hypothetical protein